MKKITIIILLLTAYSFVPAQDMKGMNMNKKETKEPTLQMTYTCPMHPEIHATKPGNCPKCGMKLVKEKATIHFVVKKKDTIQIPKDTTKPVTYTCVMHPEIHATKPGNCPKCGMKLVKEKQSSVTNPPVEKHDEMQMPKDSSKQQSMKMDNMQMNHAEKPKTETKKTIVNNTPPRTVR